MSDSGRLRVLVTGSAGRIGTSFCVDACNRYDIRGGDIRANRFDIPTIESVHLDITSMESCLAACEGMDAVLHLAADPMTMAPFDKLLPLNLVGTHHIFRAAKVQGVKRVVFASSVHAVEAYPYGAPIREDDPVRPNNLYGVTKSYGESIANYFAHREGLPSVAVRIGWFKENLHKVPHNLSDLDMFVSRRDLVHLFICTLEADLTFGIAHGVSNNRRKRLDIEQTRALFGYEPIDDAYAILGVEPDLPKNR